MYAPPNLLAQKEYNVSQNLESPFVNIPEKNIHPTAIIDFQAQIHPSVIIGPYCVIEGPVNIDEGTILHSYIRISGPTTIGKGNTIYAFASIGCDPQDKKYQNECTYLIIEDYNIIREYSTISRGTIQGGGVTHIGSHNLLMSYVHVAHDCIIGNNNTLANNASLAGHVEVGSYVGLGGFTAIHQFVRVGSYAFSGGGSMVTKDIPPYTLVAGHPVKLVGLNIEGLKRQGFSSSDCQALKEYFRILFKKSDHILETAQSCLKDLPRTDSVVKVLLEFILSSSHRGLTR